ncbi:putative aldolase [compost metagenome]
MKVGHIPLIPYHRPGDPVVAARVATLAAQVRGVLLERLGPVVWESSVSRAAFALEELEETAKLWMMMKDTPGFAARAALPDGALAELRDAFQARW